jgi:hypothetical protein
MDDFEQMMQTISRMTDEERMEKIESFKSLCICPSCPTYNKCAQEKDALTGCKPKMHQGRGGLHMPSLYIMGEDGLQKRILLHKRNRKRTKRNLTQKLKTTFSRFLQFKIYS